MDNSHSDDRSFPRRGFLKGIVGGAVGLGVGSRGMQASIPASEVERGQGTASPNHGELAKTYGPLKVDYAGLLSQHDVVYLTPPIEGHEGLITGSGEAGARIWNPSDRLMIQINHSSLWNDTQRLPSIDYGVRIELQAGLPLFDWKYLTDYEARINLCDAEAQIRSQGSMGDSRITAFYSHPHQVMVLEYHDQRRVETPFRILLERIGSQYFGNFGVRDQNPELNLNGTKAEADADELRIEQQLGTLRFVAVMRIESLEERPQLERINNYQVEAVWKPQATATFRIYVALAHTAETDDPLRLARQRVERAMAEGNDAVRAAHRADWAAQWPRSFVHLPEDRYAENLWYLVMYQNIASRRGQEPPYFIDSIWNWKQDVRAWERVYLHWNMFSPNFPLFAAGRLDLMEPYFRWKERQLPHAIDHAKKIHGVEGAFFTDYASFRGEELMEGNMQNYNLTPGPQIAMEYYQYWQYSQDDIFLKQRALPFLRAVTRFYLNYLHQDADGSWHLPRSNPYEFAGGYQFRDCIVDLAHIRWLFPALINAEARTGSVSELSAHARDVLGHLAFFTSVPIDPGWLIIDASGKKFYANPFFENDAYSPSDSVWATGYSLKQERFVSHMEVALDPKLGFGVHCGAPTAPAFPPDLISSDASPEWRDSTGKNSAEDIAAWEAMRNALRTPRKFLLATTSKTCHTCEGPFDWTGHSLELPAFARLGLAANLRRSMSCYIQKYQMYPMGMWCYWGWDTWKDRIEPRKGKDGEVIQFPAEPRILHTSLEPTGLFATTVQEMLLSSPDGVVRLFRAYDRDAAFGLHAVGGFYVSARQTAGVVDFVWVRSDLGNEFVMSSPWREGAIQVTEEATGSTVEFTREHDRLRFATTRGTSYLIRLTSKPPGRATITDTPRNGPRAFGRCTLGKARDF